MNETMWMIVWVYFSIGALVGAGQAVLFVAETNGWPLPIRLLAIVGVWALVTMIWPVTLMVLVLGKLRR